MKKMLDKVYTHIPILENNVVVGVFSENTILDFLVNEKRSCLDENTTISDFKEYLPITKHKSEVFLFEKKNTYVYELERKFNEAFKNNKRIGMVFVTENGLSNEKLLGVLTAWDVLGV